MKFSLGEINFVVKDLKRSFDFYSSIFGFKEIERGDGFFKLALGQQTITFLEFAKQEMPEYQYGDHPTISIDILVDDIKECVAHFKKHQIDFGKEWEPGNNHVFIYDPDRLVLEIIQPNSLY